ncbi:MAG: RNA polymerase subunit sigma-70 [Phycisphaeraceae bacterium]|nr:MAG: RNA polymerase subunit sigma-70 [Phycisphaeraceae bacterium]
MTDAINHAPHRDDPGGWFDQLYRLLRVQAARTMRRERPGHTLQPTALISEAYLRMASALTPGLHSKTQFLVMASTVFRRVLVEHARRRKAVKRGGGQVPLSLGDHDDVASGQQPIDVLLLDDLLSRLSAVDERAGRVVELKVFGGLTHTQIAGALGIGMTDVEKDWRFGRAWLASRAS